MKSSAFDKSAKTAPTKNLPSKFSRDSSGIWIATFWVLYNILQVDRNGEL